MKSTANQPKMPGLGQFLGNLLPRQISKAPVPAGPSPISSDANSARNAKKRLSNVVNSTGEQKVVPEKPSTGQPAPAQTGRLKLAPAFFNTAALISFLVNIFLVAVLFGLGRELLTLKALLGNYLIGGLYGNFILMDQAHIKTNITVEEQIPVEFSLPISQDTVVTLTSPTQIKGAQVTLNSGGIAINAPANIILPAGTNLPVHLELSVPVQTSIPIKLNVPVDIPLEQTELHQPFIGLQQVVSPLYQLLEPSIQSPADLSCGSFQPFCRWFFYQP